MSGVRGHNGYVLDGIRQRAGLSIDAVTGDGDDPSSLLKQLEELASHPRVYDSCEDMLEIERPEVLTIAGPFDRNADLCIAAFERGTNVFCEKPIAFTSEDLYRVRNAYGASDVRLGAMMGLRYDPAFYTAWRLVAAGEIGDVRLLNAQKSYRLGNRPDYYRQRESYGGTIPWVGSHAIDWIYWLSGQQFVSVAARHSTRANGDNGELEATALCQFMLTNEVIASATLDYLRPENARTHGDDRVRLVGTSGVLEVIGGNTFLINGDNDGTTPVTGVCPLQIFLDFIDEVAGKSTALINADDIFTVAEAFLNARLAADSHEIVEFK